MAPDSYSLGGTSKSSRPVIGVNETLTRTTAPELTEAFARAR
ncbi:MAG TPA: hypothetical protein VHT95_09670 [Vicinamibacterales bacterium]|jgi:hypothetical protein|nr:hypothetical protein [Vicinamibacterales bacterium]